LDVFGVLVAAAVLVSGRSGSPLQKAGRWSGNLSQYSVDGIGLRAFR